MSRWNQTVNIKPILHDENITVAEKGKQVASLLTRHLKSDTWLLLADELTSAGDDVEWFDDVLSAIYDQADAEGVWLGV